jgi:diguanylate cyclase (GGDEF)-like protein
LPDTGIDEAKHLAERARERVGAAPLPIEGATELLTISVGLAGSAAGHESSAELLTARADDALYRAKREGRNRCCVAIEALAESH